MTTRIPPIAPLAAILAASLAAPSADAQAEFHYSFAKSLSYGGSTLQQDTSTEPLKAELINTDVGWSTWSADVNRGEISLGTSHSSSNQFDKPIPSATMRFDDVVFSSASDAPVTVRMRLRLDVDVAEGSNAHVHVASIGGSPFSGDVSTYNPGSGILAGFEVGDDEHSFLSPPTQVPVNEPVSLGMLLRISNSNGTTTARLRFASEGPAFEVPPGVTVNSPEAMIADNAWRPAMVAKVPGDFATIQDALSSVGDGSEIIVAKGTYFEALDLSGRSDVTIRGKGKVVIDVGFASTPCLTLRDCERVDVSKLTFLQGTHGVLVDDCRDVSIARCRIDGSTTGIAVQDTIGFAIERCRLDETTFAIDVDGETTTNGSITRNTIRDVGGTGIHVGGNQYDVPWDQPSDVTVSRNKLLTVDHPLSIHGVDHLVEKNKVVGCRGSAAIMLYGDGVEVLRNRVKAFQGDGLRSGGLRCRVEKNVFAKPTGSGINTGWGFPSTATENEFVANRVVAPGTHGVNANGHTDTFSGNRVAKAAYFGFDVGGTDETFVGNRATGSGLADLRDNGDGTVYEDNVFKTYDD